jgi:hypothetical protein
MAKAKTNNESATSESQGVVLFAFGKIGYYHAAYNLAFSIKHFNKDIKIAAFFDSPEKAMGNCHELTEVIDSIYPINPSHLSTNGKFDPGRLKVNLYEYLPFDSNLYLDVDGLALKDIAPLFDELKATGKTYASHTVGYHNIKQGRNIPSMQWAWATDIWPHFGLKDDSTLPAINSSLQWIVKSDQVAALYSTAKHFYEENPLPLNRLRMKWGGGQPDELYMNAALAIHELDPAATAVGNSGKAEEGFIHFSMARGYTYQEVTEKFYLQSYYGGRGFTSRFYTEWLDRLLNKMHSEHGKIHQYKIDRIIGQKHADAKK